MGNYDPSAINSGRGDTDKGVRNFLKALWEPINFDDTDKIEIANRVTGACGEDLESIYEDDSDTSSE